MCDLTVADLSEAVDARGAVVGDPTTLGGVVDRIQITRRLHCLRPLSSRLSDVPSTSPGFARLKRGFAGGVAAITQEDYRVVGA
jgi:hypothetical protein